ncbi:hypothetical protein BSL82_10420 [Tardibacter chloracetimidivorans]|uniref:Short-chain dehydrogenase n=1 Tax=Tardibacter chloracetimidivorans TaxID=1921510 RepID=A0A1L3ZVL8_9SPHN|nr:SDR family NAD(P)-dependent oxidoreductase [Tardibacter chloracetimidivorans]API59681.1 hypothetical protein BSL82_10420 [Tardibacter chloracetimidivorans]
MGDNLRFGGRVAVITGAGNGLGRCHSSLLALRGAKVVVNDCGSSLAGEGQSSQPADNVVAEIERAGGTAIANYDTVHTREGARSIVQTAVEHFGRIDILVWNAGILIPSPLEDISDPDWRWMLGVHLDGSMFMARAAWPYFKGRGYGRLIFTSSSGAMYGQGDLAAYGAAKGGIFGFMRSLAREVGEDDLRVNAILPGAATRMVLEESSIFWDENPGLGNPAHVSALVAYLAHEQCQDNGRIYTAGAGFFARTEIMEARGIRFDHRRPVTPEQVADAWPQINDLSNVETFSDAIAHGTRIFNPA